jgi:flagellar basal body-associated protein FliL
MKKRTNKILLIIFLSVLVLNIVAVGALFIVGGKNICYQQKEINDDNEYVDSLYDEYQIYEYDSEKDEEQSE